MSGHVSDIQENPLVKFLGVDPADVEEATFNLNGFFGQLRNIEQRLIREGIIKKEDAV